jgi:hypothetical protein
VHTEEDQEELNKKCWCKHAKRNHKSKVAKHTVVWELCEVAGCRCSAYKESKEQN